MKQTLEDYIRQDGKFRQALLNQEGGIMKYWAQHPEAEFDIVLFDGYEKEIVDAFLQANKRNRAVALLSERELKLKARDWYHLTEKELHYITVLQPVLTKMPKEIGEQANSYIKDYLVDAYKDYRRNYYPDGISPLQFYNEVIEQYRPGQLARNCQDYILYEHHNPESWLKGKSEYTILREFLIRQFSETIKEEGDFKMLRQGVKEKLAGKASKECRREAIKMMKMVKDFSRMIYASTEVTIGNFKVDKEFLRKLTSTDSAIRLLSQDKDKVPPLHECFFNYVHTLKDIGCIWAAQLLTRGIDMHELEKETGAILYPVTEPTQWPDGADHGDYRYYVDKDLSDPLDDQCCIYGEEQAKELLDTIRKKNLNEEKSKGSNNMITENLASRLKDEIQECLDNINKNPELVTKVGLLVVKSKFDWSFMAAIVCGLKEEWLMDMAIQTIEDKWNECANKKEDCCYQTIGHIPDYGFDGIGMYKKDQPLKMLKYIDIKKDLEGAKADELKRRKISKKFETEIKKLKKSKSGNTRPPREHVDIKKATHSFIYKPNGLSERERNKRLITFFGDLCANSKYIDSDTDSDVFLKNFTGVHIAEKILWTAEYKQLLYLIRKLHEAGVLKWNTEKPKPRIQQMICIVFQILDNDYVEVDDKFGKEKAKHIHDIEVSNLNTKIDDKDEGLDPIIQKLIVKDKDEISGSIEEDVSDMFSELQSGN